VTSAVGGIHLPESLPGPCRLLPCHQLNLTKSQRISWIYIKDPYLRISSMSGMPVCVRVRMCVGVCGCACTCARA
jgi:hypothetical protein